MKWMRFFRGGLQRPELDTDRVLKNSFNGQQAEYIGDHILTFNDNQLLRALYLLRNQSALSQVKLKDQILKQIKTSMDNGRFELKKGNTLATFAMVMNQNYVPWYGSSKDVSYDSQAVDKLFNNSFQFIFPTNTQQD